MAYWIQNNKEELNAALTRSGLNARVSGIHAPGGSWQSSRHIRFSAGYAPDNDAHDEEVHYEYHSNGTWRDGYVLLHFEPQTESEGRIRRLARFLKNKTVGKEDIEWLSWNWNGFTNLPYARLSVDTPDLDALVANLKRLETYFLPLIMDFLSQPEVESLEAPYNIKETFDETPYSDTSEDGVSAFSMHLGELMNWNLALPDYQRDYCWENNDIVTLWHAIKSSRLQNDYHLGTIILHYHQDTTPYKPYVYDIIDGQQRLVTLSLMIRALGATGQLPLMKHSFFSHESTKHVSNAKYVIKTLVAREKEPQDFAKTMLEKLSFAVLILTGNNMDLAYTFFSAQNSRGVPLSDFDLLKAHHLRYIHIEEQAMHLAEKWNAMTQEQDGSGKENNLNQTLAVHLFRLRHWMRRNFADEDAYRHVQKEYQAAPVMIGIPPFGESFVFNEKIQGGSHFFAYAENFVHSYEDFRQTKIVELLDRHLNWGAHARYASVIESLLFGYYLKFGRAYLTEALFCICSYMAKHRYSTPRATTASVREYAQNSEIIMMVEQSSSPTFFLAEALERIVPCVYEMQEDVRPVHSAFFNSLKNLFKAIPAVSDKEISKRIEDEFDW